MGFGSGGGEGFSPGRNDVSGDFTVAGNISASSGVSAGSFTGDGSNLTNVGGGSITITVGNSLASGTGNRVLYQDSSDELAESANLTFNGTTLAVATIDVNGGAIDGAAIGANSRAAGNFTTLDANGNVTLGNAVGDVITVTGQLTASSEVKFSDDVVFAAGSTFAGTTIANLGTVSAATSITATDLIGTNVDGIIGADTARAGTFAAIVGTSLDVGDGNIANVGDIDCDTISVADTANGLDVQFGGATTTNKISLTDDLADALNITEGSNSYLKFTTSDGSEQIVFGKGSTFNGTTIADLGTVTTATSITATDLIGTNVDGIIGADTARAGTFTTVTANGNVTLGNASTDVVTITGQVTSSADVLFAGDVLCQGDVNLGNAAGDIVTIAGQLTASSEVKFSDDVVFGAGSTFAGTTIANLGTVTTATSITATDLIGTNVDGIIGADTARAGTFAAIVGTSLDVGDGNITNAGDINCDSVSVDDAAVGLDIAFGGNNTLNKISLTDDLADALNINEGGTSYLKFTTTDGSEQIVFGKGSTFNGTTIADLGTVTTATSITATDLIGTNIDGIIGADTARAGTFTTVTANGNVIIGDADADTVTINGAPSIVGVSNGAAASLYFKADEGGADAGDEWEFKGADAGTFTIGNDVASAGSYVSQMTLYPHATQTGSMTQIHGHFISDKFFVVQGAETTLPDDATAIATTDILAGISKCTPGSGRAKDLPAAIEIVGAITNPSVGMAFDWTVINLASGGGLSVTLGDPGGAGLTTVGDLVIQDGASATFRFRFTNVGDTTEAVTIYRIG